MVVVVYESENWAPFTPKKKWIRHYLEEYPSSEKNFAAESASSLTHVQNLTITQASSTVLSAAAKSVSMPYEPAGTNSSHSVISSTVSSFPSSLSNDSCSSSVAVTALPSFSSSPSFTFTLTTPLTANQPVSFNKIPSTPLRLPSAVAPPRATHQPPLGMQQNEDTFLPIPSLPPGISAHLPLSNQNAVASFTSLPNRTYPMEKSSTAMECKRKLSNSGTREVHNKLEKNRRAHLKECFELLKGQVPAIQDEKKPSNLTILRTSIRYVQILRRREQELESELERLARDKILNQQRLSTLKKELSAQWDHIDFNSLLPNSLESAKAAGHVVENSGDHNKDYYENDRDADKMAMSDADDSSSHMKSREDTYYGSSSPTGSCSISPLHISSPNVVTTMSDTLPPQIHIVESPSAAYDKLSNATTTIVSPLQFLSSSTLRMITDPEQQPIALVQHNGGDRLSESATLPKMAVHTGNTFTIFSDSFQKVNATNNSGGVGSSNTSATNCARAAAAIQFASGLTIPAGVAVNHKNISLPVNPWSTQSTSNGVIITSSVGDKGSTNTVFNKVPAHTNMGNLVNHSFVVTQPSSGQMRISTSSSHMPSNILPTPSLLKTASRLQSMNSHHQLMKPATAAVVVVSSSTAASK